MPRQWLHRLDLIRSDGLRLNMASARGCEWTADRAAANGLGRGRETRVRVRMRVRVRVRVRVCVCLCSGG